jgi:hypothetical protein
MTPRRRALTLTILALVVAVGAGAAIILLNTNGSSTGNATATHRAADQAVPTSTPMPAATPVPLTRFDPTAPTAENFALFNSTAAATIAAMPNPGGRSFIAALAAVGFDTSQMQLTADRTSANLDAPSILFSTKVAGRCFIGQFTPSTREYDNQTVDPISTGSCLIGGTVPVQ